MNSWGEIYLKGYPELHKSKHESASISRIKLEGNENWRETQIGGKRRFLDATAGLRIAQNNPRVRKICIWQWIIYKLIRRASF